MPRLALTAVSVSLGLAFLLAAHADAAAQTPSQVVGGRIEGVAVDSIHGGYLRDAVVSLSRDGLSAVTDSAGQFRIDAVPDGTYSLRLTHPILDTLGLTVSTRMFEVRQGPPTTLLLAVPSASTILDRKCSEAERRSGTGALFGVVTDADTEMPSAGAEVIVAWTDFEVGKKSIARKPQRRSATVRPDGTFIVCGIPSDLATGVVAHRGSDSTAAVPVSFANGVAMQSFHLPEPIASAVVDTATRRVAAGTALLTGFISDANGNPVKGARVAVDNDAAVAISRDDGRYSLVGLRAGTRSLNVRRLGFEPADIPVELSSVQPRQLNVKLSKFVPVLETVRISALRTLGLDRVGFSERKNTGMGRYLTPEQLDRWNSPRINDALRMVPSLRTGRTADGRTTISGRFGDCVRYFIDGHLWSDMSEGPDMFISGPEIGAIEVYSPQSSPAEFMAYDRWGRPCNSVVVWTKWKLRIK
jgi:hypothetical protein